MQSTSTAQDCSRYPGIVQDTSRILIHFQLVETWFCLVIPTKNRPLHNINGCTESCGGTHMADLSRNYSITQCKVYPLMWWTYIDHSICAIRTIRRSRVTIAMNMPSYLRWPTWTFTSPYFMDFSSEMGVLLAWVEQLSKCCRIKTSRPTRMIFRPKICKFGPSFMAGNANFEWTKLLFRSGFGHVVHHAL